MSAAPAITADAAPAVRGGKKKLVVIIVAVLLLVLAGGAAAWLVMKPSPAESDELDDDGRSAAHAPAGPSAARREHGRPPVFVPLDPFTVNLADKESERYAQIGVTLQIEDAKAGEELKLYMPAIRNNILMVLSHKTAAQLLTREGKDQLARSILVASVRPLGYEVEVDETEDEAEAEVAADAPPPRKKKRHKATQALPVTAVHFSNFIVQ